MTYASTFTARRRPVETMFKRMRGWVMCLGVAALTTSGCALDAAYDLPESPDVADAPWPRLVDAPPPISQTGENLADMTSRGVEIETAIGTEAAALVERDAEMRTAPVIDPGLYRRAERLRARAKALQEAE